MHIGKSSGGCVFSLHVYPEQGINTLEDWLPLLDTGVIIDEYGEGYSKNDLLRVITNRLWLAAYLHDPGPDAEHGPNGLLRNRVDGIYCIGHGPGTYDYIVGEFS